METEKNGLGSALKQKLASNMAWALLAQLISLCMSLALSLVVPKFLGVGEFAYWQLFIFYSNYVNFAQLGIVDGIYLKLGGREYGTLDHGRLKQAYKLFALLQVLIGGAIIAISLLAVRDPDKRFVYCGVAVYLIIYNLSRYLGFLFQAVNNTQWYSIASIIDRTVILLLGTVLIAFGILSWRVFICVYITGLSASLLYSLFKGKTLLRAKEKYGFSETAGQMCSYARVGVKLLLSNLASMLILGIGRQLIEWRWGLETFGRVSFSLSMTNFFLLFINQVSLVMFPALRKVSVSAGKEIFQKIDRGFSLISPVVYLVYIPAAALLKLWLPQYESSLTYLMLLMPLCVFDGKTQMLYNTYMKVLRKEKVLLRINLLSVLLSAVVCGLAAYVCSDLTVLLVGMVLVITVRSLISDLYLCRLLSIRPGSSIFWDLLFAVVFLLSGSLCSGPVCEGIMLVLFAGYLLLQRKNLRLFLKKQ